VGDKLFSSGKHSERRLAPQNRLQMYRIPAKIQTFLQKVELLTTCYQSVRNIYTPSIC